MSNRRNDFQLPPREPGWEVLGDRSEWIRVDARTEAVLRAAQANREASVEISCGERRYAVYFMRPGEAERVNLSTNVRRPMRDRMHHSEDAPKDSTVLSSVVHSLVDMGFPEEQVRRVYSATGRDLTKTLEQLTGGTRSNESSGSSFRPRRSRAASPPAMGQGGSRQQEHCSAPDAGAAGGMKLAEQEAGNGSEAQSTWEVFLQGRWVKLEPYVQEVLTTAARRAEKQVKFSNGHGQLYVADLVQMVQLNERTGRKRPLRCKLGGSRQEALMPPKSTPAADAGPDPSGDHALRQTPGYQVFLEETGWKKLSLSEVAAIDQSLRRGKRVFETQARGCKVCVSLEDLTWTNLETGKVSTLRPIEESVGSLSAVRRSVAASEAPLPSEPVTAPLARYFSTLAGSDRAKLLSQEDASARWLEQALSQTDDQLEGRELVLAATGNLFQRMSLAKQGFASREEWLHYWLLEGSCSSSHSMAIIQDELQKVVHEFPKAISKVLSLFQDADADFDGEISGSEMTQCCKKYVKSCWIAPSFQGANNWLRRVDQKNQLESEVKKQDACSLNYFEFVGELVGRQKHEVWLYQYDISGGLASWAAPVALLQPVEGIWHTGIVVFGREYWYGGQCFESKPEMTPFGTPMKRIRLGATLCTRSELWDKMNMELCREYTRDAYDVLTHNCNHFSDEVAMFLLNTHIPDEVRLQPMHLANSLAAHALRPLLNQWLGGFDSDAMKGIQEARSADLVKLETAWTDICVGSLVSFTREGVPPVTAEVLAKDEGTCDLWWWEPCASGPGRFFESARVSKMQVTSLQQNTGRSLGRRVAVPDTAASQADGCIVC
eukprot:TRINITY_DN87927_c0_g1_i1.p1 TRINITY_DN87927_c0_g1~~TRINITY_DN87927_c0_g1_i1.p1  ORF type:complete len:833 (+),score=183.08 TRINITY_DN87927_c0_g1_i1:77-2575(+)